MSRSDFDLTHQTWNHEHHGNGQPRKEHMTTESTTKHTPGPWETSRDAVPADHVQVTVYAEHGGERVATAFGTEANARLIAAAPDLLAALKAAAFTLDTALDPANLDEEMVKGSLSQARAAIAKAEGR